MKLISYYIYKVQEKTKEGYGKRRKLIIMDIWNLRREFYQIERKQN